MFARKPKMLDYRDLANSRRPEWEEQYHRIRCKSHHLTVYGKIGRIGPWSNAFGIWSGLSESNRHLNLGKSAANGESGTYEALSGALSSV